MKGARTLALVLATLLIPIFAALTAACAGESTSTTRPADTVPDSGGGYGDTTPTSEAFIPPMDEDEPTTLPLAVALTGGAVVPPVETEAFGVMTLIIEPVGDTGFTVSYELEVKGLTDVTKASIYLSPDGVDGEEIVPLYTGPAKSGIFSGTLAEGDVSEADLTGPLKDMTCEDLISVVLGGETYVDVATSANPKGELRGQIMALTSGGETSPTEPLPEQRPDDLAPIIPENMIITQVGGAL